jgi:hypothetical protein
MAVKGAKVFGIGFHKTGTTSLCHALGALGYQAVHGDPSYAPHRGDEGVSLLKLIENGVFRLPTIERYDAFTDNPYFSIWRELDKEYPESKFILTLRDEQEWIESCIRYYKNRRVRPMRAWMFGQYADPSASHEAKQAWLDKFRKHNEDILEYFKDRQDDLLVLTLGSGDEYRKLCDFLDRPLLQEKFPNLNRSETEEFKEKIRRWGYWIFRLIKK